MKKILLIALLLVPFVVYAACNKDKHEEYLKLSSNISYDNNYKLSDRSFIITVYNIFDGMYIVYGEKTYKPGEDNTVTIDKVKDGSNVVLDIYASDGCDQIKTISITEPYYNKFYNTSDCYGYEDKLTACSSQFTSSEITKDILEKAKYNYNNVIVQHEEKKEEEVEEVSFFQKTKDFFLNWGIKILLVIITSVVCVFFYNDKFRRIKHGI